MNNQMITQTNYNMQMEMTLEGTLEVNISQKPHKPLVFQPYTNRQSMMIPLLPFLNISIFFEIKKTYFLSLYPFFIKFFLSLEEYLR